MKVKIGQYIPGNTWLYKLDPRTKLLSVFILMAIAFMLPNYISISLMFIIINFIAATSRIPIMKLLKSVFPLMYILMFSFIFQIFNNKEGILLISPIDFNLTIINLFLIIFIILIWMLTKKYIKFRFIYFLLVLISIFLTQHYLVFGDIINSYNISVYTEGVDRALFIIFRLFTIVIVSSILSICTKPMELSYAISYLLKPFKIIKLPAEEIGIIISITLRMIPTLFIEADKIIKAQASRGVDYTTGTIINKIRQLLTILVPMFIISFKRADNLANAMNTRCFVDGTKRTSLRNYKLGLIDYFSLIIIITIFIASMVLL